MIAAIRNNKIKVEKKEDTLTSSFFGLLFYMPKEIINQFFRKIIEKNDIGNYIEYEFWPHWNPEGTTNTNFVEPDLFVRFEKIDIVIEAKSKDKKHKKNQWNNEKTSYLNEYQEDKKEYILLAIGGKSDIETKEFKNKHYNWYDTIQILRKIIDQNKNYYLKEIFNDILFLALIHGILTKEITWFEDFKLITINLEESNTFEKWIDFKFFPNFLTKYKIDYTHINTIEKWQIKKI